ncbi:phage integrase family protein [Paraburkholderia dipogonis]|uniref:phage integrase family protein n=1 Tax=Paraburkholderia dipogonis TaxID=1211383 RepID=UPI0035EFB30B
MDSCNGRGGSWWRAVPRIGASRARLIVAWLRRHEAVLGRRVDADVDLADPLTAPTSERVTVGGGSRSLVPLERMTIGHALSGANGSNRSVAFPYISAHHDLDAVRAYLYRFRQQPKTLRAYTKELERFLLWSVTVCQKPLSSLLADDCEAYKDFLASPDPDFVGPREPRKSGRWKPFASAGLGADSQKYVIRALRSAFGWLVSVRYLAGGARCAVARLRLRPSARGTGAGHSRTAIAYFVWRCERRSMATARDRKTAARSTWCPSALRPSTRSGCTGAIAALTSVRPQVVPCSPRCIFREPGWHRRSMRRELPSPVIPTRSTRWLTGP